MRVNEPAVTLLQFEGSSARSSSSLVLKSRPSSDLDGSSQSPAHFRHTPASQRQRRFSDQGESLRPHGHCFLYILVNWMCCVSVAPSIPPPVSCTKRCHGSSVESDRKEEPCSPAGAPDRRRSATASGVRGSRS